MNDNESITDFLQRHEDLWSEGLKTVSLVAELDVDDTVAAATFKDIISSATI